MVEQTLRTSLPSHRIWEMFTENRGFVPEVKIFGFGKNVGVQVLPEPSLSIEVLLELHLTAW